MFFFFFFCLDVFFFFFFFFFRRHTTYLHLGRSCATSGHTKMFCAAQRVGARAVAAARSESTRAAARPRQQG
eukprot:NODE_24578_length_619_cov_2.158537.p3 GENE.NODE_24578_length_619_cov_2.158537~~NODE_24578_length_619_cov_2.158537.p3  ORF type:complete len:72 (-),score=13.00 NODE_24578_length_619_cov_2.158537:278-493(-)